jgi:hypothetical protein
VLKDEYNKNYKKKYSNNKIIITIKKLMEHRVRGPLAPLLALLSGRSAQG